MGQVQRTDGARRCSSGWIGHGNLMGRALAAAPLTFAAPRSALRERAMGGRCTHNVGNKPSTLFILRIPRYVAYFLYLHMNFGRGARTSR